MLDLMREEGVLIGSDGKHGNVLKLRPPLVFSHDNATQVVAALDRAFSRL
jgi:4-aminobutyrate aminotransferase-like enzyme